MLRSFKSYTIPAAGDAEKGSSASSDFGYRMSGYAGVLSSVDDFYLNGRRVAVQETSNEVFNTSLYSAVIPQTVPEWLRVVAATRLANTGEEWVALYSRDNSGTYNNQWMVVDYKRFHAGQPLRAHSGLLWVLEQIPGKMVAADQSGHLATHGYWASYNVPFYPEVFNMSGYGPFAQRDPMFSYHGCARAKIFARDATSVATIQDMRRIMRYNAWQTDPLSLHDACRGISARCDLNAPWGKAGPPEVMNAYWPAFGAVDAKMVSAELVRGGVVDAVCGPTWDAQPPFAWTEQWSDTCDLCPQVYAFPWRQEGVPTA
eukprot:TRINITY_DN8386_c0_g1_i1.p1 TRINITY_DN8386_c0_g1~~TRINITY_DN8386_c0_g1_i1.p1  ORF type:complete len:316 (+),score=77.91 TRINITY_DN8386_c0_g1_i1:113-1060(+)